MTSGWLLFRKSTQVGLAMSLVACASESIPKTVPGAADVVVPAVHPQVNHQDDAETSGRCANVWPHLMAGKPQLVPLAMRCRLAEVLAGAALETMSRSRTRWTWEPETARPVTFAALVGSANILLVANTESCPLVSVPGAADGTTAEPASVEIQLLGRVERATRTDLAVRLRTPAAGSCSGVFTWRVGDTLGLLPPPPPEQRRWPLPMVSPSSIPAPGPLLVVEVTSSESGDFAVVRRALEVQ